MCEDFGNKKALFATVNESMEARILESVYQHGAAPNWQAFLQLCDDPHFRRIVLQDSPNILGCERWLDSTVTRKVKESFIKTGGNLQQQYRQQLIGRMAMAAFAEAALIIAEAEHTDIAKQQAEALLKHFFGLLAEE